MVGIRILFFKFWMPDPEISTAKSYTHAKPICTHTRIVEGIYRIRAGLYLICLIGFLGPYTCRVY
jgi:hypothetical protein